MNIGFDSWFKGNFLGRLAESNRFVTMYLALDLLLNRRGQTLVETGTIRQENDWGAGMSTLVFGSFCKKYNHRLHTVDVNTEAMEISRRATAVCRNFISYHSDDSVSFLKNFNHPIDLLYLDSMDCPDIDDADSPKLIASQNHQLREIEAAFDKLSENAVVLLDDNDFPNGGKTRLSKLFLQQNGYSEIMSWRQSLWVKSSAEIPSLKAMESLFP